MGRAPLSGRSDRSAPALVASGRGEHVADFETYLPREGSVVWIRSGMVHRWSGTTALTVP
ncbi:hypothetical protein [Kitasatospora purpeofusca]|uniref:hypothetical protein n=1 Tax=Kitasatospora purpeofusca TaxID=67352 RepID=UPI0035DF445A